MPGLKILCIGDLHFRTGHLAKGEEVIEAVVEVATSTAPDIIVLMGDILHTHNLIQVRALRQAEKLFEKLSDIAGVYVLMGNHDFINPTQNQTENHGFNAFKKHSNITIIDRITTTRIKGFKIVMCPYLPYGEFVKSQPEGWKKADLILAHQPFRPVDPRAEKYPSDAPVCYSGHIHDWDRTADNLVYVGSSVQVAADELPDKYAWVLTVNDKGITDKKIRLAVRSLKTIGVKYEDLDAFDHYLSKHHDIKLIITLTREERAKFIGSKRHRKLQLNPNIRVCFDIVNVYQPKSTKKLHTPEDIILQLLKDASPAARKAYELIRA